MRNQLQHETQSGIDSLIELIGRRRVRRWSRRARIAAPFLVVPAILGLLILSVDLIEYQPQTSPRAASQPTAPVATRHAAARPEAVIVEPQAVSSISVVDSPHSSASPLPSGMEVGASADAARFAHPGAGR